MYDKVGQKYFCHPETSHRTVNKVIKKCARPEASSKAKHYCLKVLGVFYIFKLKILQFLPLCHGALSWHRQTNVRSSENTSLADSSGPLANGAHCCPKTIEHTTMSHTVALSVIFLLLKPEKKMSIMASIQYLVRVYPTQQLSCSDKKIHCHDFCKYAVVCG